MAQRRTITVTDEMVILFKRGLELQAAGHDDVDDNSPEADEFARIDKELNWQLLKLPAHMVSVLDPLLDGSMPKYMPCLAAGRDWGSSVQWRRALQAALDARRK
ncbi:hypothetical protein [Bradyrhizobium sp. Cp5.3]|uniref:hypothetical protein n=1 Tax=Bradyrhizobium sp. Cp5.3 TaxID=443598 RepID=UPI00040579D0|nr:hypothetical protein [Bradyrhizobium sp. Cp5.3]